VSTSGCDHDAFETGHFAGRLPLEVQVPNAKTRKAIEELEAAGGESLHGGTKEVFEAALGAGKKRRV